MADFSSRKTLALTPDGDIKKNARHRFEWVEGEDAVIQEIKTTMSTLKGEDPFDEDLGMQVLSISNGDTDQIKGVIAESILTSHEDDVERIEDINIESLENREMDVTVDLLLANNSEREITL